MGDAAIFLQLSGRCEVDACDAGAEAAGIDAEDESPGMIVIIKFFEKQFHQFHHFFVLLRVQHTNTFWQVTWRLQGLVKTNQLIGKTLEHG